MGMKMWFCHVIANMVSIFQLCCNIDLCTIRDNVSVAETAQAQMSVGAETPESP